MRTHLAIIAAHENHVKILIVEGKIGGGFLGGRGAVSRHVLSEIAHSKLCFTRLVVHEVFKLGRFGYARDLRKWNRGSAGLRGRGFLSHSRHGETQNHPRKQNTSDPGAHAVYCLYLVKQNRATV